MNVVLNEALPCAAMIVSYNSVDNACKINGNKMLYMIIKITKIFVDKGCRRNKSLEISFNIKTSA